MDNYELVNKIADNPTHNYLSKYKHNLLIKPTFWGENPQSELYLKPVNINENDQSRYPDRCVYDIR